MTQQQEYRISVTTHVVERSEPKVNGHGVTERLITVRGNTIEEAESLYRQLLARLPAWDTPVSDQQVEPSLREKLEGSSNSERPALAEGGSVAKGNAPFCNAHNVVFTRYGKDGRSWYAHKHGNGWCRLRERKSA